MCLLVACGLCSRSQFLTVVTHCHDVRFIHVAVLYLHVTHCFLTAARPFVLVTSPCPRDGLPDGLHLPITTDAGAANILSWVVLETCVRTSVEYPAGAELSGYEVCPCAYQVQYESCWLALPSAVPPAVHERLDLLAAPGMTPCPHQHSALSSFIILPIRWLYKWCLIII